MLVKVFSIRDSKAEVFNSPFFLPTRAMAIRTFAAETSNSESMISKYPSDFALYEIGSYDDQQGRLEPYDVPVLVNVATDFLT